MTEGGAQVRADPVLEETFYITSKKNTFYRVKLSEKGLSLQKESNGSTKTETIALSDIIGCRCMRSKKRNAGSCVCHPGASRNQLRAVESSENIQPYDELDTSAYLYIYAYPMKKPRVKGARRRERSTLTLRFRSFDRYEDNLREASKWRLAIKCLIAKIPVPKSLLSPTDGNLELLLNGKNLQNSFFSIFMYPFIHSFLLFFFPRPNFFTVSFATRRRVDRFVFLARNILARLVCKYTGRVPIKVLCGFLNQLTNQMFMEIFFTFFVFSYTKQKNKNETLV